MANEYLVNSADLTAVADAIRNKGGTSEALAFPDGFVDAVGAIQAGGGGEAEPISMTQIYRYDVTEEVQEIVIPWDETWLETFGFLYIVIRLESTSRDDWLYFGFNSADTYTNDHGKQFDGQCFDVFIAYCNAEKSRVRLSINNSILFITLSDLVSLNFSTFANNKGNFAVGGSLTIFGGVVRREDI